MGLIGQIQLAIIMKRINKERKDAYSWLLFRAKKMALEEKMRRIKKVIEKMEENNDDRTDVLNGYKEEYETTLSIVRIFETDLEERRINLGYNPKNVVLNALYKSKAELEATNDKLDDLEKLLYNYDEDGPQEHQASGQERAKFTCKRIETKKNLEKIREEIKLFEKKGILPENTKEILKDFKKANLKKH